MDEGALLTVKLSGNKPVELVDLTVSLAAFAEAFEDYSTEHAGDPLPGNVKLYIREMRSGSIVADLMTLATQASMVLSQAEMAVGFVRRTADLINYLKSGSWGQPSEPERREVERIARFVEPVAKDHSANIFVEASDQARVNIFHVTVSSLEANAVQNAARRFLGPSVPGEEGFKDQFLALFQVKNKPETATGDMGIIKALWPRPVKLRFLSAEVKNQILDQPDNPFQKLFLVDGRMLANEGKPKLYEIAAVKEVLEP